MSWVALAYLVAFASCLPIFGRLCEMFGRKSLYLIGYRSVRRGKSHCAVLRPTFAWLIVFRVLQGIGGSLLGANSISILVRAVDQSRQRPGAGVFRGGPGDRHERRSGGRWSAARHVGMALGVLDLGPVRACRPGDRMAGAAADRDRRPRQTFDWHGACCWPRTDLTGPGAQPSLGLGSDLAGDPRCAIIAVAAAAMASGRQERRRRLRCRPSICSGAPPFPAAPSRSCWDMRCFTACSF